MNEFDKERLFWILQNVKDGEMDNHSAESIIKEMISDIEDDAFQRGLDSVHGAYNNLV